MGIAKTKQGDYDYWYTNPVTGKRAKKRILKADGSRPKDEKEAERLIANFRREVEDLDSIKTRERAVLELSQARQLIASKTHTIDDIYAIFEKSATFPASEGRRKYAQVVLDKYTAWCHENGVESITDADEASCQKYIDKGLADLAGGTVKKHIVILSMAFREAVKKIGLASNPWRDVKRPAIDTIGRKDFTTAQVEKICGCFETWFVDADGKTYVPPENDQMLVCFILGLYAGMRLKDACLAKWGENIDMEHATITYTPQKTRHSSGKTVTLPIMEGTEKKWLERALEWRDDSGYVCPAMAQQYDHYSAGVSRTYIKCFELAAGVKNHCEAETGKARSVYGFHSLRTTCASILVNAGVDLSIIAEILGHNSVAMTRVYAHVSAKRQAEEMQKAFGAGAATRQEINNLLDKMTEKQIKQVLQYCKYMMQ